MFNIWVQAEGQNEAQHYDGADNYEAALHLVDDLKEDAEVVMCDELPLGEAMAELDVDGQFQVAWRMRVAGAEAYDIVAIVQEP